MFRIANGLVSWNSTLQQTLASLSMEEKFMTSYDVVTEIALSVGVYKEMELLKRWATFGLRTTSNTSRSQRAVFSV